ncbi:methionine biosynthesis protein MetW, partial [PVC group bacterium]|nr:methionine biosynthesis protein MetW [PVC group bacterium]
LSHARKIGHITYLSPEIMQKKFGRQTKDDENAQEQCFQIESYLDYQGEKFVERFDANSYLRITQAMDAYDLVKEFGSLDKAFKNVVSKFLIVGLSSDWLFPPEQSNQLANALLRSGKRVSCCILRAPYGHDAFLIDVQRLADTVRAFLPWAGETKEDKTVEILPNEKDRFSIITNSVQSGARVLDLGCGDGQLLSLLKEEKKTNGLGLDINIDNIVEVINKGHDIFQGNLDEGLSLIPDDLYDYAILSSTLQVVKKPKVVLREMLRVAKEGIVTLPNFGNWHNRIALAFSGRMPKSGMLPYEWYDTPNIHLSTLKDFVDLCRQEEYDILDIVCIPGERILDRLFLSLKFCNLGAERVLFRLAKKGTGAVSLPNCRVF